MTRRLRILAASLLVLVAQLPISADSAPLLMNFQGRLANSVGSPVTTAQTVDFTLIEGGTDSTGGVIVYQEQSSVTPDSNGVFTHVIGTGTPLGGQTFEEEDLDTAGAPLWIELNIASSPLLPRTRVLSVAYAIEASRIDGKTANDLLGQGSPRTTPVRLVWNDVETVNVITRISSDITLQMNDDKYYTHAGALTWSFNPANRVGSTEGLGLDTGAESVSTWYYLYAVPHTTDIGDFTVVASVTPPPTIGAGPTGYTAFKYLGAFRNNTSSDIRGFTQTGKEFRYTGNLRVTGAQYFGEAESRVFGTVFPIGTFPTALSSGDVPVDTAIPLTSERFPIWIHLDLDAADGVSIQSAIDGTTHRVLVDNEGGATRRQREIYHDIDPINRRFQVATLEAQNQQIDFYLIALGFVDDYVDP